MNKNLLRVQLLIEAANILNEAGAQQRMTGMKRDQLTKINQQIDKLKRNNGSKDEIERLTKQASELAKWLKRYGSASKKEQIEQGKKYKENSDKVQESVDRSQENPNFKERISLAGNLMSGLYHYDKISKKDKNKKSNFNKKYGGSSTKKSVDVNKTIRSKSRKGDSLSDKIINNSGDFKGVKNSNVLGSYNAYVKDDNNVRVGSELKKSEERILGAAMAHEDQHIKRGHLNSYFFPTTYYNNFQDDIDNFKSKCGKKGISPHLNPKEIEADIYSVILGKSTLSAAIDFQKRLYDKYSAIYSKTTDPIKRKTCKQSMDESMFRIKMLKKYVPIIMKNIDNASKNK